MEMFMCSCSGIDPVTDVDAAAHRIKSSAGNPPGVVNCFLRFMPSVCLRSNRAALPWRPPQVSSHNMDAPRKCSGSVIVTGTSRPRRFRYFLVFPPGLTTCENQTDRLYQKMKWLGYLQKCRCRAKAECRGKNKDVPVFIDDFSGSDGKIRSGCLRTFSPDNSCRSPK